VAGWKHFLIAMIALAGVFIIAAVLGFGIVDS
jgi:hypothetical protein